MVENKNQKKTGVAGCVDLDPVVDNKKTFDRKNSRNEDMNEKVIEPGSVGYPLIC